MASLTIRRAAGGLLGADAPTLRDGPHSSTLKTWVSDDAGIMSYNWSLRINVSSSWSFKLEMEKNVSRLEKVDMGFLSLVVSDVIVQQDSATSDGFLSSTEYSLWASTMKLQEDEALPTLKQSRFLSLPSDAPPQVSFFLSSLFACFFVVQDWKAPIMGSG